MATVNLERPPHLDGSSMSNERLRQYLNRMVEALAYALGHLDSQNIREGGLTTASVSGLDSKIARAAQAEVGKVKIGAAQIQDLKAQVARIVTADIGTMNVDWAAIDALQTVIAEATKAAIGEATIDFAQIRDLIADKQIITKGEAGELYIADLNVTEGNMARLTLGQLLLKGADGKFYELVVNDGEVTAAKTDVAAAIEDGSVDAGEKLIDGSITAAKLNVQDIFADNAMIRELLAANIDVGTLFAREATINAINAMDILANKQLRVFVDEQSTINEQIRAWFNFASEGELSIGRSDQAYNTVMSYDGFAIRYHTTKTLYFREDKGFIPRLDVEESFTLGDLTGKAEGEYIVWS